MKQYDVDELKGAVVRIRLSLPKDVPQREWPEATVRWATGMVMMNEVIEAGGVEYNQRAIDFVDTELERLREQVGPDELKSLASAYQTTPDPTKRTVASESSEKAPLVAILEKSIPQGLRKVLEIIGVLKKS